LRWNFVLRIVKKSAKFAKIRTRKNLVPHGRLPDEFYVHNKILARERSLRVYMKFKRQISEGPITHRALDRRTLLFLLYNAKF